MKDLMRSRANPDQILMGLYTVFFASVVFSLRAVTTIAILSILVAGLVRNRQVYGYFMNRKLLTPFFAVLLAYFILKCVSLLQTENLPQGLKHVEKSAGLIIIPLALYASSSFLRPSIHNRLIRIFIYLLLAASLFCLCSACLDYFSNRSSRVFFHHQLVAPLQQHAIQFSLLVFIALMFLIRRKAGSLVPKGRGYALLLFFSFFLLLLSSKLVLVFYFFFLGAYLLLKRPKGAVWIMGISMAAVLVIGFTSNPLGNRFRSVLSGDQRLFLRERFDQDTYFNGVQFRLLQWRLVYEILEKNDCWFTGMTPGDAQKALDQEYVRRNIYTGEDGTGGLLGYHTHNQFLQALLQNGIPGLTLCLLAFAFLASMMRRSIAEAGIMVLLFFLYCFTDAMFETQYGIVIFSFFPLFSHISHRFRIRGDGSEAGNP